MIIFAARIKELRLEKQLSQADLAKAISVNQRTISNWEKSVRQPDFETLAKLAEFFQVSCDYLLGLED